MDWTELIISVNIKQSERAAAIAHMAVPGGIYIEDYSELEADVLMMSNIDLIEDELLDKPRDIVRIHIYINALDNPVEVSSFILERLNMENIEHTLDKLNINEEDWANNWKKYFKPMPIGKRLVIRPEWEEYQNTDNRVELSINPGMAFGTGTHETTQLCLLELEERINEHDHVLDIGCGSGILSIASVLLGAECALGVDIDAQAVKISRENAALNNLTSSQIDFKIGSLVDTIDGKYNIIIANIIASVVISLTAIVKKHMTEDGLFIASGIIEERVDEVLNAMQINGLDVLTVRRMNAWVAITAKRRKCIVGKL